MDMTLHSLLFSSTAERVYAWLLAHPNLDVVITTTFVAGILNRLQSSPWGLERSGLWELIRRMVDMIGLFPHDGANGILYGIAWKWLGRKLPPGDAQVVGERILHTILGWWNLPGLPSVARAQKEAPAP